MLVLSRKKNETIVIDGGIEIQVLQLKGGMVRLGINAPRDVRIVRGELELFGDLVGAGEAVGSADKRTADKRTADKRTAVNSSLDHEPELDHEPALDHEPDRLLETGTGYRTGIATAR